MTSSEICQATRQLNLHIQLRDVWFILRQFTELGLIRCFNPTDLNGKIYFWTDFGLKAVRDAFGLTYTPHSLSLHWHLYARVVRAKVRRLVLLELAHIRGLGDEAKTTTVIRRRINEEHPIGLNAVSRTLKELSRFKLVRFAGEGNKRGQKLYRLTQTGQRIANMLT